MELRWLLSTDVVPSHDSLMNSLQKMDLQKALCLTTAILEDYGRLCTVDVTRDVQTLITRVSGEGQFFFLRTLLALGKGLLLAIESGRCSSANFPQFRVKRSGGYPIFLQGFLERIFDDKGAVRDPESLDVGCFKAVYQLAKSWYKHEVDCPKSTVCEQYRNFILLDRSLAKNQDAGIYDTPECRVIYYGMHRILTKVLDEFSVNETNFFPRHGSGTTSEGFILPSEKWAFTYKHLASDEFLFPEISPVIRRIWENRERILRGREFDCELIPIATLTDVPKESDKRRLINEEATAQMMKQQTVFEAIVDHLENHCKYTRGRVNFTRQEINQELAKVSTRLGGIWATIDWKDASDRVLWKAVRTTFPGEFVSLLGKCRSAYYRVPSKKLGEYGQMPDDLSPDVSLEVPVDYANELRKQIAQPYSDFFKSKSESTVELKRYAYTMHKHAPMGSSLCFPVMALFIWACAVQRVARELLSNGAHEEEVLNHACSLVYIYGDDLIVPSEIAQLVISDLELIGMKANNNKSFVNAAGGNVFRESCGVDALNGVDVTPVKFKAVFPQGLSDIGSIESWVEYTNELADRGLILAAHTAHSFVSDSVGRKVIGLLHNTDNPEAIHFTRLVSRITGWYRVLSPQPKWDAQTQQFVRLILTKRPCTSFLPSNPKNESIQLFRWLCERDRLNDYHRIPSEMFDERGSINLDETQTFLRYALPVVSGLRVEKVKGKFVGWREDRPKDNQVKIVFAAFPPLTNL